MSQDEDADAEHTFPAGKYFIGDPCYALSEDTYGHWGTLGYATGKIVTPFGIFIVARIAYIAFYLSDKDKLRSLAWLVGVGSSVALLVASMVD